MNKKLAGILFAIFVLIAGCGIFASCKHVCTFREWQTVNAPTCTEQGLKQRICSSCGETETQILEIDPNNHKLKKVDATNADCTNDGKTEHQQCVRCNKYFDMNGTEIPLDQIVIKAKHTLTDVSANGATCTTEGNVAYKHCTVCQKNFDGSGNELTDVTVPVDSTNHNLQPVGKVDATCTTDGTAEHNHCTRCGKNFDVNGNELTSIVIPKGHKFDSESIYCSVCKKHIIQSAEDLCKFRDSVNSGNNYADQTVILEADIELDGQWVPIGNQPRSGGDASKYFKGTFDGQNHTISGINITVNVDDYCASLFGITANAVIKNLIVQGTFTNEIDTVAGIVGCDLSLAEEETLIDNCKVENSVITGDCVGGIISRAYGAGKITISNCQTKGVFATAAKGKVGGIVCINKNFTTISNCINYAEIKGGNAGTAGIIAYANSNVLVVDCINYGTVGTLNDKYVAGILGYQAGLENVTVRDSVNNGNITGISAGGIYGVHGNSQCVTISGCKNNGEIVGVSEAGGIACTVSGTVTNCLNNGKVTATGSNGLVGGVVGRASGSEDLTVSDCSGGTAALNADYKGRIIGAVHNGLAVVYLSVDDNNGDDYSEGLPTVGCVGMYTAYSTMVVQSGTLRGQTVSIDGNGAAGWIVIEAEARWVGYDESDEKTTWLWNKNTQQFEKTSATPIPLQPKN